MRLQLRLQGKHVAYIAGANTTLEEAKKRVPSLSFDEILPADEAAIAKIEEATTSLNLQSASDYAKSREGKFDVAFSEHERSRVVTELAERKAAFRKTYREDAGDSLVVDNFQDGRLKAPFSLIVRNETADPVKFTAVVRDAPYEKIPALVAGDYSLETVKSEGGYTHTFTGKLEGYASISITGGVPNPAGSGKTDTSPELYLA